MSETFGRFLSDEIVRQLLDTPDGLALGGKKRELTMMMSDLRGFTALSERMQPQDLITMLNHYFGEMYEEIERYHGTLIEFMGDGMLVVFGAPTWRESHAADAVAAAIGMQRRMKQVNSWNREHGWEALAMGIGINSDEMILGNIGSEKRTKYGVLGAAVNLAGRIESYTTAGQILISPGTRAAVEAELEIRKTMLISPKGVAGEIQLSDVRGIGSPFSLRLDAEVEELTNLPSPVPLRFSRLEGKRLTERQLEAELLAVSKEEALLKTDAELKPLDNVCLDIGADLYAKLTKKEERLYRISFTAKPPCFEEWLRRVSGRNREGEENGLT